MKRFVPFYVRVLSLLVAAGITTSVVFLHAADLTTLGAPATAAAGAAVVAKSEHPPAWGLAGRHAGGLTKSTGAPPASLSPPFRWRRRGARRIEISNNPVYLQQEEAHLFAGLRKAGIPE